MAAMCKTDRNKMLKRILVTYSADTFLYYSAKAKQLITFRKTINVLR